MGTKTYYLLLAISLFLIGGCDDGTDDWNSSATISGDIYADPAHTVGIPGVQVVVESDPNADNPYEGPDRWTSTDANGHFEGHIFLGRDVATNSYVYLADVSVAYFWQDKFFRWTGGITVAPGSHFTLPAVDTTMFLPMGGE